MTLPESVCEENNTKMNSFGMDGWKEKEMRGA